MRAINVPIRSIQKARSRGRTNTAESIGTTSGGGVSATVDQILNDRVRPFVKVHFQNSSFETTCQEGPGPIWNEVLRLPVKLPDGQKEVTPRSLLGLSDNLVFSLMDERIYDQKDPYSATMRARPGNTNLSNESYCHRFLGSFSIPFSVLYVYYVTRTHVSQGLKTKTYVITI